MNTATKLTFYRPAATLRVVPGLAVVWLITLAGGQLSHWPPLVILGPLTLAMFLGFMAGHASPARWHDTLHPGVALARHQLLRLGVVLYGVRLNISDLSAAGTDALITDVVMITTTLAVAAFVGVRLLRLEARTALLIGMGSAVCGAAAVLASAPTLKAPSRSVAVAIATVVLFGSAAMCLYPVLYTLEPVRALFSHSDIAFGRFTGATIHEVAQVAAAARDLPPAAAHIAIITKLMRVLLLVPLLFVLGYYVNRRAKDTSQKRQVPWFAVIFLLMPLANTLGFIPASWQPGLTAIDELLLGLAMAALGFEVRLKTLCEAGWRPLLLGAILFIVLMIVGALTTALLAAG